MNTPDHTQFFEELVVQVIGDKDPSTLPASQVLAEIQSLMPQSQTLQSLQEAFHGQSAALLLKHIETASRTRASRQEHAQGAESVVACSHQTVVMPRTESEHAPPPQMPQATPPYTSRTERWWPWKVWKWNNGPGKKWR